MALEIEDVVGCCVDREKFLRGPGALETLHLALSSSGRLMRVLGSIVAPSTTLMAVRHSELMRCGAIVPQIVRD